MTGPVSCSWEHFKVSYSVKIPVGTRSLLFGAHCFFIHPIFVFIAWWRLYGFPWDPRLWIAFVVHDWGYWGKQDMDGLAGESHPELGAWIMGKLFGSVWRDFTLFHSRRYAKHHGGNISRLCVADKLATIITPSWIYLPLVTLTGEIKEYMSPDPALESKEYITLMQNIRTPTEWFTMLRGYMWGVVERAKDSAT